MLESQVNALCSKTNGRRSTPFINRRFSLRYDNEVISVLVFKLLFYFNPYLNPLFLRGGRRKTFR